VLPGMLERGFGRIINIVGGGNFFAYTRMRAHFAAAKAGVHGLTKVLAREFASAGVTVNTVAPGLMDTERDWVLYQPYVKDGDANASLPEVPMHRFGHPDEAAAACMFLAGDAAGYISGQVIHINGAHYVGA
jgi:3-oxoacyl-[acyl-carrier protein] reductase